MSGRARAGLVLILVLALAAGLYWLAKTDSHAVLGPDPWPAADRGNPALKPSDPETQSALGGVVRGQLRAFGRRDYAAAIGFASSPFQGRYTPDAFRAMVENGYPALAAATEVSFGEMVDDGATAWVTATVTDAVLHQDTFRYSLVKETNQWRIVGVIPAQRPGRQ